jgi:arabinogalactan oligomer / maltooligosaccharide transport system permease protein
VAATAVSEAPKARFSTTAMSLPSRLVAFFSGPVGLAAKIAFLAIVNAFALWAAIVLVDHSKWIALGALVAVTAAIDAIYFLPGRVPAKFLIPGTFFLIAFQVIPVLYTVNIAFTNWSTGHLLVKSEAIDGIKRNSLEQSENGKSYTMAAARDDNGNLVLLLVDEDTGKQYVGSKEGLKPLPAGSLEESGGIFTKTPAGYKLILGQGLVGLDKELSAFTVPTTGDNAIRAEGLSSAVELHPTLRYDPANDRFVRIADGVAFTDNGRGSYVHGKEELEPGWRTNVGFTNFSRVFHNKLVRQPFIRVLIWTLVFATSCVFLSFFLGLFLAITLSKDGMRFRSVYRSVLVLPYAIPGFLSILVWGGLLNDDFGVVNRLLGHIGVNIPWLFDPNWARVSVILVSVWLTFPYFFLVSLGALASIPGELVEAARVDGAGRLQVFRKVTLPLLLVAVAPLMIASFAFNFNNFANVYLLTGGGPASNDQSVAGATDILISYTYKIAFASGKGQDFGLASTISIFIFLIVGTISAVAFSRTKALENLA